MRTNIKARLIVKGGRQVAIDAAKLNGFERAYLDAVLERDGRMTTVLIAHGPERALYDWFGQPAIAPFGAGTLLHFSILVDEEVGQAAIQAFNESLRCDYEIETAIKDALDDWVDNKVETAVEAELERESFDSKLSEAVSEAVSSVLEEHECSPDPTEHHEFTYGVERAVRDMDPNDLCIVREVNDRLDSLEKRLEAVQHQKSRLTPLVRLLSRLPASVEDIANEVLRRVNEHRAHHDSYPSLFLAVERGPLGCQWTVADKLPHSTESREWAVLCIHDRDGRRGVVCDLEEVVMDALEALSEEARWLR